jgi:glycosyltransferase involved in cell wall biosynthesis
MQRAAILFSSFGPYHVARIEALGRSLKEAGHELTAFRFSEGSDTYGWIPVLPEGIPTVTLAPQPPAGAGDAWRLSCAFHRELKTRKIGAAFLPTYSPLPNLLCVLAAKVAGCRTILMTESWFGTEDAGPLIKLAKHGLVRMFDSALVGGTPQRDYVAAYGMPREKIFTGYDVVDTDFFAARAEEVRKRSDEWRVTSDESGQPDAEGPETLIKSLPERFFLNLGRFVEKKNLSTLIAAYARYCNVAEGRDESLARRDPNQGDARAAPPCHANPGAPVSLLLVGEGPLRGDLERQARELGLRVVVADNSPPSPFNLQPSAFNEKNGGAIFLYPFQQSDMTPVFFALCEAFVLPSTREEWGLVVNEAMACGAPVIVSRNVGCAQDLVGDVDGERGRRGDRSVTHPAGHTDNAPGTFYSINNTAGPEVQPYPGVTTGGEDTAAVDTRHSPLVTPHSVEQSSAVGFTFDPQNVDGLAELLGRFAADPTLRARLGDAGLRRIQGWTPERFGREGLKALHAASG